MVRTPTEWLKVTHPPSRPYRPSRKYLQVLSLDHQCQCPQMGMPRIRSIVLHLAVDCGRPTMIMVERVSHTTIPERLTLARLTGRTRLLMWSLVQRGTLPWDFLRKMSGLSIALMLNRPGITPSPCGPHQLGEGT